jgi:hypothetical protein
LPSLTTIRLMAIPNVTFTWSAIVFAISPI